ncbi:MAG TPA: ABC transporter ATP-binding protein [Candidatus Binatia bacterium]|nr:ABC transporter ATP-binding protein [Candidatus Binatia bacterium]
MDVAIRTEGLTKDYGGGAGLFDLDLQVESGEVFGYLGPNGAGKTTTIRLLMDMIRPTRGRAEVFAIDCQAHPVQVKREVGYVPGEMPQWGALRGREVVAYVGGLRGGADAGAVSSLATRLDLDLGRRFREYSSGNKRKLGLVLAFMHRPRLLVLDEPTNGLDPLIQQEFFRMIEEVRERGATVFLSSHVLSEVERICQRVGILRRGHLVQVARLDELHHLRYHRLEVDFAGEVPLEAIRACPGIDHVASEDHHLVCDVHGSVAPLLEALGRGQVLNLVTHEPSLEEVFLAQFRDEPVGTGDAAEVKA